MEGHEAAHTGFRAHVELNSYGGLEERRRKPFKRGWAARNKIHLGDCQNYGPFLGPYYSMGPNTGPNLGDPKRDHNFDNPPSHAKYHSAYTFWAPQGN